MEEKKVTKADAQMTEVLYVVHSPVHENAGNAKAAMRMITGKKNQSTSYHGQSSNLKYRSICGGGRSP